MRKLISALALLVAVSLPSVASAGTELFDAVQAMNRGDYATALPILEDQAEAGDRVAAEVLGDLLWYGETLYGPDVKRDPAAARKWLLLAYGKGSRFAAYMLNDVVGVENDLPAAVAEALPQTHCHRSLDASTGGPWPPVAFLTIRWHRGKGGRRWEVSWRAR